jgi:hypothetical protein
MTISTPEPVQKNTGSRDVPRTPRPSTRITRETDAIAAGIIKEIFNYEESFEIEINYSWIESLLLVYFINFNM